jgi:uncharacterized protein (TIGR02687 family)
MEAKHVNDALDRIFHEENARIVFWNDPDREFQNVLPFLLLENVTTLRLDEVGGLDVKIRLENEDPTGKHLLYSPTEEPDYDSDWLLDIRLYSRSFRADRASILLSELGLKNQHLRQHLAERRKFFDNKERLQKLHAVAAPDDIAVDIDRKMIAVVVKAEPTDFFSIVRTLFNAYTDNGGDIDLDVPPPAWEQIEKFDLADFFWETTKSAFGYAEDAPSLKKLLIRLIVSDYAQYLKKAVPAALANLVLPPNGLSNAVVCLAQWRDSSSRASSYDRLSGEVAALIRLEDHLNDIEIDDVIDVMTFLAIEKAIASQLRKRVQDTAQAVNADDVRAIANRRQAGHWASPNGIGAPEVPRQALHAVYDALVCAADFFTLRNQHQHEFDFADASSIYRAYETDLYRFDQLYRHFCEAADHAESQGWNILKPLRDDVEACYANWFIPKLALAWGKFVDPQGTKRLLNAWQLDQIPNQQNFFNDNVRPRLNEAENRRVYVVISDAFRYEAAQELTRELNGKYRFEATLASQLGVLPSYTALGMASLLPHAALTYKSNGEVLADGKPTQLTEQRDEVLKGVEGMACKADELVAMKKEQGREFIKDHRVVYVYHDTIDAIGDKRPTENKTFEAVRRAIDELAAVVTYIINNLNGNYIFITADHGFLFTESAPGDAERSKLDQRPDGTVRGNNRYLLGQNLADNEAAWHGKTSVTAGVGGGMEFWIPRGANRFHFGGGARFIHGGAMLQEIVVPVITVRHVKGKSAKDTKSKPVTVHVLGSSHKITTGKHRFELIQVEPVGDRVKAVTLKVAVYAGEEPVTNIESVTFDSASEKMDERKRDVRLVLQDRQYDKKASYRLVLRDAETGIEQQSVPVIIDRAFSDDF